MSENKGKIVACLDLGTTKTTCIIAAINEREISILGYSYKKSKGINASAISNVRLAQESILKVVSDAEKMAGFNINKLIIGLSGSQITSKISEITNKTSGNTVRNADVTNLARKVLNIYAKSDREIVHLVPLKYKIDDSNYVENPQNMSGKEITTRFHIVSTAKSTTKNIENCLKTCQLSINNYVSEAYCCALSCLSDSEFNIGSLIIDMSASSTSFCVMIDGKFIYNGNIELGGINITKDISTVLNVDFDIAEQIKRLNSSLILNPIEEKELIKMKIGSFSDNFGISRITKKELKEIMSCRIEEIIELVKKDLDENHYGAHLFSNIIITGGVSSIIGIEKIVSKIFNKQAKIGFPQQVVDTNSELSNPSFSSAIGMLIYLQNIYKTQSNKENVGAKESLVKKAVNYLTSL